MPIRSLLVALRAALSVLLLGGLYAIAAVAVVASIAVNVAAAGMGSGPRLFLAAAALLVTSAVAFACWWLSAGGQDPEGVELHPEDEPELWGLVEGLAYLLGTPPPMGLFVVAGVDAWVSDEGGWLGLRPGQRRMGLGLGLVQVVDSHQLRAVLAHELGHCAGGNVWLGPVICRAQRSLTRAAVRLGDRGRLARLFGGYARLFDHVSLVVRRQQELAADAAAVRLGGRDAARAALCQRTGAETVYRAFVSRLVEPLWATGQRPVNLYDGFRPALDDPAMRRHFEAACAAALSDGPDGAGAHPPLRLRLANAAAQPQGLSTTVLRPARDLFRDITALERRVTLETSRRATGSDTAVGLRWDEVVEAAYGPRLMRRVADLLKVVAAVDGATGPVNLSRLCSLIDSRAGALAEALAPADATGRGRAAGRGDVEESGRAAGWAQLHNGVVAVVACALVAQRGARWQLSWSEGVEVALADGDVLEVDADVSPTDVKRAIVYGLRETLMAEGVALQWAPAAVETPAAAPVAGAAPAADGSHAGVSGVASSLR